MTTLKIRVSGSHNDTLNYMKQLHEQGIPFLAQMLIRTYTSKQAIKIFNDLPITVMLIRVRPRDGCLVRLCATKVKLWDFGTMRYDDTVR